jgi:hypothetical protein
MQEQLKKAIKLAKLSGGSVIMFNPKEPQDTFVLLDLKTYENYLTKQTKEKNNLTDEDLADKINREISLWKNKDNPDLIDPEENKRKRWQIPPRVKSQAKEVD